jgi:hypothetical protein
MFLTESKSTLATDRWGIAESDATQALTSQNVDWAWFTGGARRER